MADTFTPSMASILTLEWVFDKWYEKLVIVLAIAWSIYSIYKFVGGFF